MQVKVSVKGMEKVMKALSSERWSSVIDTVTRRIAEETLYQFQRIAPKRTGRLVASAYVTSSRAPYWLMKVDAPYAAVVEFGSRPHIIMPRRARVLHFFVKGAEVFARRVKHPGTRAQLVVKRALDYAIKRLKDIVGGALRNV